MCSLEEAFQTFGEPEPRNADLEKKRKKKRRTALPEPEIIDPDRPANRPLPPAELLGGPPTENRESTSHSALLTASDMELGYFAHPNEDVTDPNVYSLETDGSLPDWLKGRVPSTSAETPLTPSPWMDGQSTLWQNVPHGLRTQMDFSGVQQAADSRLTEMQRRLDSMFSKLEDLETTRSESNHLEIIMFVLGGIFILLIVDMLVKQGMRATMMVAAAGGSRALASSVFG
jgi:hypothetical protein